MAIPVLDEEFTETLHTERIFRNHAPVGGTGHRRHEGGITGVSPENLNDEQAFV